MTTLIYSLARFLRRNRPGRHWADNTPTAIINVGPNYEVVDRVGRPVGRAKVWHAPNVGRYLEQHVEGEETRGRHAAN